MVLLAFGVYQSILYFGHTAIPNSDFPDFFQEGKELLSLQIPKNFKRAPVLGVLQNFLYPLSWGPSRELTAGWLLNAILHPLNLVLLWLIGKRIVGKAAAWIALILIINPWTVYLLTDPIVETTYMFFILLSFYLIFIRSKWAYLIASAATMVRYEGAMLIAAAFVADIIHRKNRRDVIKAIAFSAIASLPLVIWLVLTAITWQKESAHYLNVFFSREYAKTFAEPVENRTGIVLNMRVLWQTGFAPLLTPYPAADENTIDMIFKLNSLIVAVGFALGCIFSILRRQWQIWMLLLFFVPYFTLHAFYPYPIGRFHSTIVWIAMFICWSGLQSVWQFAAEKWGVPKVFALVFQITIIIIAILWLSSIAPYLTETSSGCPRSASMPYAAVAVAGLIFAGGLYTEKTRWLPKGLAILTVMSLMIVSSQFHLVRLLGDGQKEIEFRQLGEWFAANARPDEKIAVYMDGPTRLFAGKNASNVIGFPKAASPAELADNLRNQRVTYVVWATREGMSTQHSDYRFLGLDKNIAFLNQPKNIGCYEFVRQIGSNRGYVNVFRLKEQGEEQLPVGGK